MFHSSTAKEGNGTGERQEASEGGDRCKRVGAIVECVQVAPAAPGSRPGPGFAAPVTDPLGNILRNLADSVYVKLVVGVSFWFWPGPNTNLIDTEYLSDRQIECQTGQNIYQVGFQNRCQIGCQKRKMSGNMSEDMSAKTPEHMSGI